MESRFYELPRETRIGSKNRRVREIGGKISVLLRRGDDFWYELSGGSKKRRVREIGIPLYKVFPPSPKVDFYFEKCHEVFIAPTLATGTH